MKALDARSGEEGEIFTGEVFGDFRGLYADEVATQLFFQTDEDIEPFKEFIGDLRDLTLQLMRFIQLALRSYFDELPEGTVTPVD